MKHIFITGSTGAIGSALVPLFLNETQAHVHLLVRANSDEHLRQRSNDLLQFWGIRNTNEEILHRMHFCAGDVCRTKMGLLPEVYDSLTEKVTHIIHCAGNVKLNQALDQARSDAVGSTENVVDFAKACNRRGQFRKLDVTSTVGVAGRMRGLILEEPLRAARSFRNTYEAAKADAEDLLWRQIENGFPLTIHRPSMVVGDSRTGMIIHFQVFYYLCEFLTGRKSRGYLPRLGNIRLDTIPVDYVARSLYIISGMAESRGRVFHLCSGPQHSVTLRSLVEAIHRFEMSRGVELYHPKYVPSWLFRQTCRGFQRFVPKTQRRLLETVPYFLEYLREDQSFDVRHTSEFLANFGMVIPKFPEYIDTLLTYHLDRMRRAARQLADSNDSAKSDLALASF